MSIKQTPTAGQKPPVTEQAKRAAAGVADKAKTTARNTAQNVADTATSQAEAAKTAAADEVSGVASAMRTAALEMRNGSPQERTFGQIAEGIADLSDAMREKDLSSMVQDVSAFARKNPLTFLGGAVLIGFAATRFAKASGSPTHQTVQSFSTEHSHSTDHGDQT